MMRHWIVIVVLAGMLFIAPQVVEACPSCAQALDNDPAGANPAEGFYWSILAMMAMPFLLAGSFGGAVYFHMRKNHSADDPQTQVR